MLVGKHELKRLFRKQRKN